MVAPGPSSTALTIERISLDLIFTSPHQMRRVFDSEALRDLAQSMKQEGLIQPITVRRVGDAYELIVGERRLRAARMLKWEAIEARVIEINDESAAVKGLIENLQRADLSPIEEARGYKQLVEAPYNLTQDAVAQRVGKCQAVIARCLALLDMPQEIQDLIPRGIITETHTRALRRISDRSKQVAFAKQAHREGWTAKEMERRVTDYLEAAGLLPSSIETPAGAKPEVQDPLKAVWEQVEKGAQQAGMKVAVTRSRKSGGWTIQVRPPKGTPSRRALADFFMRLGHLLNNPQRLP